VSIRWPLYGEEREGKAGEEQTSLENGRGGSSGGWKRREVWRIEEEGGLVKRIRGQFGELEERVSLENRREDRPGEEEEVVWRMEGEGCLVKRRGERSGE
jgi:hypothetical protein